ncbi:MAG: hypothetical protein Fur0022_18040 [Anaerolineales bacterium]
MSKTHSPTGNFMASAHPLILTAPSSIERDDDCACPDKAFLLSFKADTEEDASHDCACPDGHALPLHSPSTHTHFTHTAQTHTTPLPHGFWLAFSPYTPSGPSVLNQAAWERWQLFQTPRPLRDTIDHQLAAQFLLSPNGKRPHPQAGTPQTLTAWLHITNACNLDCPYCYVRKSSERLSVETGLHAVESIFQTARENGFQRVKLKYAGGEATLHFRLVRQLHQRAQELSAETGLRLKAVVLSNGVHLRPEDADWLLENQVKLMISVDGVGEAHNRLRPQKGGGDTFERVQRTVDEILIPRGLRPDVTMTITRLNAHAAPDVARWAMIDRGLPLSLNFYRQNLLSASRTDLELEEQTIITGMLAAYQTIETHLPTRPFLNGLLDRVQAEAHAHTCGVGQSYVVISHTGQLAQCQMHLQQPVRTALNGENLIPLVASGPIQNLSVDQKEGCRECEFRYRCTGGCPLETYRATGRWDIQSPNCRIYKTLFPAALRLEGLRLMKVNGYLT